MKPFWMLPACLWLAASPSLEARALRVHESTDPFYDQKTISTDPIVLRDAHSDSRRSGYLALVLERATREESTHRFQFKIFCGPKKGRQLDIGAGNSLTLILDGRRTSYYSQGTAATRTAQGAREEIVPHALYEDVPGSDLEDLARARRIDVRVSGEGDALLASVSPAEQRLLKEFIARYVTPVLSPKQSRRSRAGMPFLREADI